MHKSQKCASGPTSLSHTALLCHTVQLQQGKTFEKGLARTQIPTNRNDAFEFPTFGEIAGVNQLGGAMSQPRPGGTALVITVHLHAR